MASLQQVVEQLVLLAASGTNATTDTNSSSPAASGSRGPIELLMMVYKMLFSATALRDWAILVVIGSLFETARRLLSTLWSRLINSFFVTVTLCSDDVSYEWIMRWLSTQPSWKGTRNFEVATYDCYQIPEALLQQDMDAFLSTQRITYLPAAAESYPFWYKHTWIKVLRTVQTEPNGYTKQYLTMSIMTRNDNIFSEILQQAMREYAAARKDKITIYVADSNNCWREVATRPMRPLNSIVLDPGVAELVVDDVHDFLNSKEWYAERGIPFRRGYLLYGAPGSGKTSLIHSIAGELGLSVYIVSLSRSGLDDSGLSELISSLPEKCIALMEDIDAAFHHGVTRESPADSDQPSSRSTSSQASLGGRVSLSGLLNALDGIGAQEGRVLFATTNKYGSLDPALCRPGRMDLHIEFKLASRLQAEVLFKRFYDPSSSSAVTTSTAHSEDHKHPNGRADIDRAEKTLDSKDLIDLSEPHGSLPSSVSEMATEEKQREALERPSYVVGLSHRARGPALSYDRIESLAVQFAQAIPEREFSMASLQGFLMLHKTRPFGAVAEVGAWVEKERRRQAGESEGDTKT